MAFTDCCSMSAVPVPENTASIAGSFVLEVALEVALDAEPPVTDQARSTADRQHLPEQAPPPLYTLHSAFLIRETSVEPVRR